MIRNRTPPRVVSLAHRTKPFLKAGAILVAFVVLYLVPDLLDKALDWLILALWLADYDRVGDAINTLQVTFSPLATVFKIAVVAFFAARFARVHELLWHRWRHLRAVFVATLAVLVLPGLWSVTTTALGGGYAAHPMPEEAPHDPSVLGPILSDFTSVSSGLMMFLPFAVLVYFYLAFNPESLGDYRDVLVATVGFSAGYELYHNFTDALADRLVYTDNYAWAGDGLLAETWGMGLTALVLYYGVMVLAFLWIVEYAGGEIEHDRSGEAWL